MYHYALKRTLRHVDRTFSSLEEARDAVRTSLKTAEEKIQFDADTNRYFIDVPSKRNVWISVYNMDLCYGGNEEGGWWYDHYSLETSIQAKNTPEEVAAAIAALEEEYPHAENYSSVLGGHSYIVFAEYHKGSHTTRIRPRYE